MPSGIEEHDRIAFTGDTPWHGLGVEVTRPMTSAEALTVANLDWSVSLRPVYFHERMETHKEGCAVFQDPAGECNCGYVAPPFIMDPEHFVVVRNDTLLPLHVSGSRYAPIQNRHAFECLDGIVGEQAAMYHTVGSLYNGRKVWMLVQLPGYITVKGDDVGKFLLLANAHDGSMCLTLKMTPVRVVCANTLAAALSNDGSTYWRLRHTLSLPTKIEAAREALGIASQRFEKVGELYRYFGDHNMTVGQVETYLNRLFPDKDEKDQPIDGADEVRSQIVALLESEGKGLSDPKIKFTAWAAYNAVTEYLNWKVGRKTDARLQSMWFGPIGNKIQQAMIELMHVIDAPAPKSVHPVPANELDPELLQKEEPSALESALGEEEAPEAKDPSVYDGDDPGDDSDDTED
jgi:phage/plasmid-like protein (TIGR03299 family)